MRTQIQNVIDEYQQKMDKVNADRNLSQYGKTEKLAKLTGEKKEALKAFAPELRKMAVKAGLEAEQRQTQALAGRLADAEKWDYNRLSYEANAAKAAIRRSEGDVYEAIKQWEQVKESHDRYKIKAFIDTVPLEIPQSTTRSYRELMQDMNDTANVFEKSPETGEHEQGARAQLDELRGVKNLAAMIDEEIYQNGAWVRPVTQKRIMKGMNIDDNGKITLDFQLPDDANLPPIEKFDKLFNQLESARDAEIEQLQELGKKFHMEMGEEDLE